VDIETAVLLMSEEADAAATVGGEYRPPGAS